MDDPISLSMLQPRAVAVVATTTPIMVVMATVVASIVESPAAAVVAAVEATFNLVSFARSAKRRGTVPSDATSGLIRTSPRHRRRAFPQLLLLPMELTPIGMLISELHIM